MDGVHAHLEKKDISFNVKNEERLGSEDDWKDIRSRMEWRSESIIKDFMNQEAFTDSIWKDYDENDDLYKEIPAKITLNELDPAWEFRSEWA